MTNFGGGDRRWGRGQEQGQEQGREQGQEVGTGQGGFLGSLLFGCELDSEGGVQ